MSLQTIFESLPILKPGNKPGWNSKPKPVPVEDPDPDLDLLQGAPTFTGGLCEGLWHTFDPPRRGEDRDAVRSRWRTARGICADCPVLALCRDWFDSLPDDESRPGGVVAGEIRTQFAGRQKNEAAA